ncbi:hypothetical protein E5676_scaffold142G003290 [Cucumis melo var. makuwa]|uniref:Uncharacterized protein n=1 Tax=Cucumis melo var. makuwa TaxID=1194695 RepID=A0A5D3DI58_CUCMM|nr:hypothetical protein E5676_scaffold142G003290 [Cucumis melo var. makuwa]
MLKRHHHPVDHVRRLTRRTTIACRRNSANALVPLFGASLSHSSTIRKLEIMRFNTTSSSPVACLPSRSAARTRTQKPKSTLVVAVTCRIVPPSSPQDKSSTVGVRRYLVSVASSEDRALSSSPIPENPSQSPTVSRLQKSARLHSRVKPSRQRPAARASLQVVRRAKLPQPSTRASRTVSLSRARLSELPYAHEPPDNLDQVILERGISPVKGPSVSTSTSGLRCLESVILLLEFVEQIPNSSYRVVSAWVSSGITTYLELRSDSSDSTGSSQPDCLSVSSEYATDQFVLGVPLGHRRPDFVPTGSHVVRVRERASSWTEVEVRARASWRATRSDRGEP